MGEEGFGAVMGGLKDPTASQCGPSEALQYHLDPQPQGPCVEDGAE